MEDTKNQFKSGLLSAMLSLPEVKDVWFQNQEVKLDGYRFVHCRFDSCQLSVSGTDFILERCFIDSQTTIQYLGSTIRIIKLFLGRWKWAYQNMRGFVPTRHDDGTLSID